MASKAQHIRLLYDAGASVADISAMLDVSHEYVRVCARQRRDGRSCADKKDRSKAYKLGDRDAARRARGDAYKKHRLNGKSSREARSLSGGVYTSTMIATGRHRRFHQIVASKE